MYGIDLLVEEHQNIISFTEYIRKLCCGILDGEEVPIDIFHECVDFGRNYADKHHHGKEEKILFCIMQEQLGTVAEKLIRGGMLVEHDLGRYHMRELKNALQQYEEEATTLNKLSIITHASGYADLLKRHIEKEDEVAYAFADRMLSQEAKRQVDEETREFEEEAMKQGIQRKYLDWLKNLSK